MTTFTRLAGVVLACGAIGSAVHASTVAGTVTAAVQESLADVVARHGVAVPDGSLERAFDERAQPTVPVRGGSLATPLAVLASAVGASQIDAAYAFGILAGPGGLAAMPQEIAAAGRALTQMLGASDRRSRVAAARVSGRLFAPPLAARPPVPPPGLVEALFSLWNHPNETEQLAAMDAIGLLRVTTAVTSLTERYRFYRDANRRALAGGALEALARIGDPSSVALARAVAVDPWSGGRDATALAVAFARERLLQDGSAAAIRQAVDDRARRVQALGYLAELGLAAP